MHCVNHPGVEVQSYCQSCGKPLCVNCVRKTPSGQVFCDTCQATAGTAPNQAYWQAAQAFASTSQGPNPKAAAILGLIPGVGAMYNGQLFKGLIHVIIFAVLVSITDHYTIFLIFVFAWCIYQSFEAFHTAKARRDGLPVPDPFGLNEVGSWLNMGGSSRPPIHSGQSATPPPPPQSGPAPSAGPIPGNPAGFASGFTPDPGTPPPNTAPYTTAWGPGYEPPPYSEPYAGPNPDPYAQNYPPGAYPPGYYPPGAYPPGAIPPIPPDPLGRILGYRGKQPIWAFILIGLGIVFLLDSLGVEFHFFRYTWPLLLIGLGVWLIVRRVGPFQGGSK